VAEQQTQAREANVTQGTTRRSWLSAGALGAGGVGTGVGISAAVATVVLDGVGKFDPSEWLRLLVIIGGLGIAIVGLLIASVGVVALVLGVLPSDGSAARAAPRPFELVMQSGLALVVIGSISLALGLLVE
jgi:hypothetical protein